MHALVTGATGFIGQYLVEVLCQAGWTVSVVCRPESPALAHTPVQIFPSLALGAEELAGIDCIFHLAGLAHADAKGSSVEALEDVNVRQTVSLFQAAQAAGVQRFIWLSSIKVLGDGVPRPYQVSDVYQPVGDYARSKVNAELQLLQQTSVATQLHIVRPPLVYGPGVKANFKQLIHLACTKFPLPLAAATAPRAWLGLGNLADFLLHLAHSDPAANLQPQIWHVRDAEQSDVVTMLRFIANIQGCRLRLFYVNADLFKRICRWLGLEDRARRVFDSLLIDDGLSRELLGWHPPYSQLQQLQWTLNKVDSSAMQYLDEK